MPTPIYSARMINCPLNGHGQGYVTHFFEFGTPSGMDKDRRFQFDRVNYWPLTDKGSPGMLPCLAHCSFSFR